MTPNGKQVATRAAKNLIQQKIQAEKKELDVELAQILAGAKAGSIDIREKKGRELFLRLMFVSLVESFGTRMNEVNDIDIKDMVDQLLKITRQMRDEVSPNKGSLVSIFTGGIHGVGGGTTTPIQAVDANYDILKPPEPAQLTTTEVKNANPIR